MKHILAALVFLLLFGANPNPAIAQQLGELDGRSYLYFDNSNGQPGCALMIALHGKNGTKSWAASKMLFHEQPDCMVSVYVQGEQRLPDYACWNGHRYALPRNGCEGKYGDPPTMDRQFIVDLIDSLTARFQTSITVLAGHSNGGRAVADIACHHPGKIDLVALVSSRSISEDCVSPLAPVRFLSIVGKEDPEPGITLAYAQLDAANWIANVFSQAIAFECPDMGHPWESGSCGSTGIVMEEARKIQGWVP